MLQLSSGTNRFLCRLFELKQGGCKSGIHGIWVLKPCIPEELIGALTAAKAKVAEQAWEG